ncbi:YfbM family protein [Kitasatospora sp. NPDC007106]|uniref:YfbM family protein n=1 Tax=Kitasatospora sp. NPDC007106 TaxID=3156914 RepID=UPI0033C37528
MSIVGRYTRLTPSQSDRAMREPGWARELAEELAEAESERQLSVADRRCHEVGTAWHALAFLLDRRGLPVDLLHGEAEVPDTAAPGYGPPRLLDPERVRLAADSLAELPPHVLTEGVTADDLAQAHVYPAGLWQRGDALEVVAGHYLELAAFVRTAARYRHALLVRLG